MYKEILYQNQEKIIGLLKIFSADFYLAGGTAIALQLGHRKSLDFDLFSSTQIDSTKILYRLKKGGLVVDRILVDNLGEEFTLIISGVKITFLYYPFDVILNDKFEGISIPDIETLGAMKFYTLGRRGKWKDYIDIYTILNKGYTLKNISALADKIFDGGYNEKLLREQFCYFDDIDYTEQVEYIGEVVSDEIIKKYLINISKI